MESIKQNDNQTFLKRIFDIREFGSKVLSKSKLNGLRKPERFIDL